MATYSNLGIKLITQGDEAGTWGTTTNTNLDIVDVINSKKAKDFQKVAKKCTCTFECASAINTVYDPKH